MPPSLLITGGSGFLGRRAADHFRSLGFSVLTPSHRELDITNEQTLSHWFRQHRPDYVLHCAAVSDTGACERDPQVTARINVEGSCHLAKAAGERGARLILCSSDQVYWGSPGPHKETEDLSPQNVYGRQKLLAETLCREHCPDTVALRLSWMYDALQLPGEHGNFLVTLTAALKDPSRPLTWPVYDRRGITDVNAVVRNLPKALSLPAGVYNFGSENSRDTYHTVKAVLEDLSLSEPLSRLSPNTAAFAAAPRDIRMEPSKAAAFGISFPSTRDSLTAALRSIL